MQVLNISYIKIIIFFILFNLSFATQIITTTDFSTKILIDLKLEYLIIGECGAGEIKFPKVNKLSKTLITNEKLYEIMPKVVIGREGSFQENRLGTKQELKEIGIEPFIFYSAGPNSTLEDFYKDLKNLGKVLGKEDIINNSIKKLKDSYNRLENKKKLKKAVFISSVGDTLGVVGSGGILKDLLLKTDISNLIENKADNYFKISWEFILDNEIDIIYILSKDEEESQNKYDQLRNSKLLNQKKAMLKNEVYFLNYFDIAPNIKFLDVIENLNTTNLKRLSI